MKVWRSDLHLVHVDIDENDETSASARAENQTNHGGLVSLKSGRRKDPEGPTSIAD